MDKPLTGGPLEAEADAKKEARKRIILVEDEAITAMDLKSNLILLGYEVPAIVSSGEDAIRAAADLRPDLILMDIKLHGSMSGIETADEIRSAYAIPVVFLTAHSDAGTIERAKTAEPFGYLHKPCSMDTLMSTIEVALYKGEADSQRRNAEARLKQVVNEQKIILDNIGIGVLLLKNRKIMWGSRSLSNIFGYSFGEIGGKDTELLYPDRETYLETGRKGYAALARGEVFTGEVRMKRKDGSIIWCNLIGQAVNPENLEDGTIWMLEDVTERRKTEEYLVRARNLESLGILAGGIAHDFNNLLQGLLGNITLAMLYTPETSKAFPFLKIAESAYNDASRLTNQLIAFSTGGISSRNTIQPAGLIREAVSSALSGSDISAQFDLPDDLLSIHVDTAQFQQAIGNIALNAREALSSGETLIVSAANEILRPQDNAELEPGKYIRISIRDQGPGIPADILPKIFDPYFSTKERGLQRGMGLGLTISNTIITKHKGAITVESEPGRGAAFHIYLPAAASDIEDTAFKSNVAKDIHNTGPRIIIMDDEPAVFRVTSDFLELFGYRVDSVINGDEVIHAYKMAREAGDPYAAVILDLTIPDGMGGKEAITRLRELDPDVKAIVSSGYANDPAITDCNSYGFTAGIVKPYRLETLKEMLEKILQ